MFDITRGQDESAGNPIHVHIGQTRGFKFRHGPNLKVDEGLDLGHIHVSRYRSFYEGRLHPLGFEQHILGFDHHPLGFEHHLFAIIIGFAL